MTDNTSDLLTKLTELYDDQKLDEAEEICNKMLLEDENNTPATYFKGLIEDERGNFAAAERHYRRILSVEPDAPHIPYVLATNLLDQGKVEEAETFMDKLEEDETVDDYQLAEFRSLLALAKGDKEKALAIVDEAIEDADEEDVDDLNELREIIESHKNSEEQPQNEETV